MGRSCDASTGSFRARDLELLASTASVGRRTWKTLQVANRDGPRIDPRRDPAYHNRMLSAAANR